MSDRNIMVTSRHTYRNPIDRACFRACVSCLRCANKGMKIECDSCSGHPDQGGQRIPHDDHFCDCANGVMRWVTKDGRLIVRRYLSNPFKSEVRTDAVSQDERDWNEFLSHKREMLNNPEYDPISFSDGTSTTDHFNRDR